MNEDKQEELPLEWPEPREHYRVEILRGNESLRSHEVTSEDDAFNLIEGIRQSYALREGVVWDSDDVDATGQIHGLLDGADYTIRVTPPISV